RHAAERRLNEVQHKLSNALRKLGGADARHNDFRAALERCKHELQCASALKRNAGALGTETEALRNAEAQIAGALAAGITKEKRLSAVIEECDTLRRARAEISEDADLPPQVPGAPQNASIARDASVAAHHTDQKVALDSPVETERNE